MLGSPYDCAGEGLAPGNAVVENRYAEARPNAAAIIAACWSGGAIKTSFFRGLTGEVPGRSARCRLGDAMDFFEISEREAHATLCSCLFGGTVEAGLAAGRVRELLRPEQARSGHQWWGFR